jgi:hypothetical protein
MRVPRESGAAAWNFSGARPTHKLNGLCRGEYIYDLAKCFRLIATARASLLAALFVSAACCVRKAIFPPFCSARATNARSRFATMEAIDKLCEALQFHLTASANQFNYAQFIFPMCANDNKTMPAAAKTSECVRK